MEAKEIKGIEPQAQQVAKKENKSLVATYLGYVENYALTSGETLSNQTKSFAVDIITMANKSVVTGKHVWNELDIGGCGFVEQVKRWAKLGLNAVNDKMYVDIRNNGKTGKKDIYIKMQYQGVEKLMVKYFGDDTRRIVNFKTEVLCIGDVLEIEEDFETGLSKITGHTRNEDIDRNKLENITGAYKIAYALENGKRVQYVCTIDKNRIMRAYNASPSNDKGVWNKDTQKMVKKTVTWEMWNSDIIRPFMVFPDDLINDIGVVSESETMNWNKENEFEHTEVANTEVKEQVASEDIIDMDYDD